MLRLQWIHERTNLELKTRPRFCLFNYTMSRFGTQGIIFYVEKKYFLFRSHIFLFFAIGILCIESKCKKPVFNFKLDSFVILLLLHCIHECKHLELKTRHRFCLVDYIMFRFGLQADIFYFKN
jgi:hypothetical protein